MKSLPRYVLVLDQDSDTLQMLESVFRWMKCSVVVASSVEQAIAKAHETPPSLIILSGNQNNWSKPFVHQLRSIRHRQGVTIVALTDCHASSWLPHEDNPGVDGFLVKPLSPEVLATVVQSAWARQMCYSGFEY